VNTFGNSTLNYVGRRLKKNNKRLKNKSRKVGRPCREKIKIRMKETRRHRNKKIEEEE
jgi:hypothetical protein